LKAFLRLEQSVLLEILGEITDAHINKPTKNPTHSILRKRQNMQENSIVLLLEYGVMARIPFETTKQRLLSMIDDRSSKLRHEKLINRIHNELKTDCAPYENEVQFINVLKELTFI
jgi:hypothetical protein